MITTSPTVPAQASHDGMIGVVTVTSTASNTPFGLTSYLGPPLTHATKGVVRIARVVHAGVLRSSSRRLRVSVPARNDPIAGPIHERAPERRPRTPDARRGAQRPAWTVMLRIFRR